LPSIGFPEILVILAIALIVFGPKRLPEMGRTIGRTLREFRRTASEVRAEIEQDLDDDEPPRAAHPRRRPSADPAGDGESSRSTPAD
jgi:sec-independent protein translocase protein TatA